MSDASDAFASPVVRKVGGQDVSFPRLTAREYGVLESAVRQKLSGVDRELLDECQIVGERRYDRLRESAQTPVTMGHVDVALMTEGFARKAVEMSLKKAAHPNPAEVLDAMPIGDLSDLARVLVGFLVPFDNKKLVEWHGLAAAIRKHFPGTDPAELTMGQLSHLLAVAKVPVPAA